MSDEQSTYLLLAVLYLVECCLIAGKDSFLFLPGPLGRIWRAFPAGNGLAVRHGFLAVLPPLTPWRPAALSSLCPLLLHPAGIIHRTTGREILWEDVEDISSENAWLHINGTPFVRFQDDGEAARTLSLLKTLRTAPPETRSGIIRTRMLPKGHPGTVGKLIRRTGSLSRPLRLLGTLQLLFMFLLPPFLFRLLPAGAAFLLSAALVFMTGWCIAALFFAAHRKLYPERRGERWGKFLHFLLYPPGTPMAAQALSIPLGGRFHPAAWACTLLPEQPRQAFLARMLRESRHPILRSAVRPDTERRIREACRGEHECLYAYLEKHGAAPPEEMPEWEESDGCTHYCPRCLSIYRTDAPHCPSCSGIPLLPLSGLRKKTNT